MKGQEKYLMKLQRLVVNKLYGAYNYDVMFNSDITFLYGTNGCGKTTILNITEAIITGMLFKLFEYKFQKISLFYYSTKKSVNLNEISIKYLSSKKALQISFDNETYEMEFIRLDSDQRRAPDLDEIANMYFESNPFLTEIKQSFNYVYLPLNRTMSFGNSSMFDSDMSYRMYNRRYVNRILFEEEDEYQYASRDINISKIENLIYYKYNSANAKSRDIENDFRRVVLQMLLEVNANQSVDEIIGSMSFAEIASITPSKIMDVKKQYIAILEDLTSANVVSSCESFFQTFLDDIKEIKEKNQISVDFLFRYKDFLRIQQTVSLADHTFKAKEKLMKTFELFSETMNSFISQTEDGKKFVISAEGRIGFMTKYSKRMISVQHLSSGEKQLLIFFANLIFGVDSKKTGIFVVDEPELSLHLSWQRLFVEKTMSINPNMQLIFATHSPEFVGNYRDRMYKLEKLYT